MTPDLLDRAVAVLTLSAGFNSAVVVLGAACLGLAAGVVGSFLLLRKRALVGDALGHATLPGIALAFLAATWLGLDGRSLPWLLAGAAASGWAGVLLIQAISSHTRLPEDAAIGAVLSVSFGLGVVLLSHIQTLETGNQAGLTHFILGQTAAMNRDEALTLAALALLAAAAAALLFKEFRLVCFDAAFARGQGWPVAGIDVALLALVTMVTVAGLRTVGLILILALLVIPPAAARFWTERLPVMVATAGALGAVSGWVGATLSALFPRLPAGGVIVLAAAGIFLASFLLAPARGVLASALRLGALRLRLFEQSALRRLLAAEAGGGGAPGSGGDAAPGSRGDAAPGSRGDAALRLGGDAAVAPRWLRWRGWAAGGRLTPAGRAAARAAERNHRLWERFLAEYPSLVPGRAAWGVDPIDRTLPPDLVRELEVGAAGGRGAP
jgi:manganese/zinc/iron transport system permease protein